MNLYDFLVETADKIKRKDGLSLYEKALMDKCLDENKELFKELAKK